MKEHYYNDEYDVPLRNPGTLYDIIVDGVDKVGYINIDGKWFLYDLENREENHMPVKPNEIHGKHKFVRKLPEHTKKVI